MARNWFINWVTGWLPVLILNCQPKKSPKRRWSIFVLPVPVTSFWMITMVNITLIRLIREAVWITRIIARPDWVISMYSVLRLSTKTLMLLSLKRLFRPIRLPEYLPMEKLPFLMMNAFKPERVKLLWQVMVKRLYWNRNMGVLLFLSVMRIWLMLLSIHWNCRRDMLQTVRIIVRRL